MKIAQLVLPNAPLYERKTREIDARSLRLEHQVLTWVLGATVATKSPSPDELVDLDLWVDPTVSENDLDGFVAEALVCGVPVVAARTPVNRERLSEGQAGFLVPPGDPNELTHAMVTALFKSELRDPRLKHARDTPDRFRADHRTARLLEIYADLTR